MVVGMLPLILADGAGAKSRFEIGLTIFAGMAIGTVFTLFVTPAVYTFIARDHRGAATKAHAVRPHLVEGDHGAIRPAAE
jgi:Cu/Ag efflux pump CusA